jgi:CubicO group peptidase (beta-lactamase class C family)
VRDKIFRPFGLSNTGFSMPEMSQRPNFAVPLVADSYADAKAGRFTELPLDNSVQKDSAEGDIYSSALDLARWGQVIMKGGMRNDKQVLSREGIKVTLTAHTVFLPIVHDPDFAPSLQYGMGWMLNSYKGNNFYEHSKQRYHLTPLICKDLSIELKSWSLTNLMCLDKHF